MALIKLSSVGITNISGKAGGSVYAHNKGGSYVRSFAVPSNPQSGAQMAQRSVFGALAAAWRSLTQEQMDAWRQAAESFPSTNVFGDKRVLSGISLYQKLNRNLQLISQAKLAFPPAPEGAGSLSSLAVVAENTTAGDATSLSVTGVVASVPGASATFLVYATPALSPGVNSAKNRMRLIDTVPLASMQSGADVSAGYTSIFGQLPIRAKIRIMAVPINNETGERGADFYTGAVVTEAVV